MAILLNPLIKPEHSLTNTLVTWNVDLQAPLSWLTMLYSTLCVLLSPAAGWRSQISPRWVGSPWASGSCSQTEAAPSLTPFGPCWRPLVPRQRSPPGAWGLLHLPSGSCHRPLHPRGLRDGLPQDQGPACCLGDDCGGGIRGVKLHVKGYL